MGCSKYSAHPLSLTNSHAFVQTSPCASPVTLLDVFTLEMWRACARETKRSIMRVQSPDKRVESSESPLQGLCAVRKVQMIESNEIGVHLG